MWSRGSDSSSMSQPSAAVSQKGQRCQDVDQWQFTAVETGMGTGRTSRRVLGGVLLYFQAVQWGIPFRT